MYARAAGQTGLRRCSLGWNRPGLLRAGPSATSAVPLSSLSATRRMSLLLHQRTADFLLRRQPSPLLLARLCAPQRPPWQPRHHSTIATTTSNSAPAAVEPTPTERVASGGFHEFGLHPKTVQALRSHFAIHQPSPIQSLALPAVMTGDDVVLGAETGSGKTLAYLLPVMHALTQRPPPRVEASKKYPSAVVLLPNKELCDQVLSVCQKLVPPSISVKAINGTELPNKRPDILLTTPNGLVKSLNDEMLHWVRHIVIDEADLMLSPVYHDQAAQILDFFKRETRRERRGKGKAPPADAEVADTYDVTQNVVRQRKAQFIFVAATIPLQDKSKSLSIYLQKHFKHVRQVYTHNFHKSLPNIALTFVPLPEEVEDRVQTLVDLLRSKSGVRVEEAHPQDQGLMEEEDAYTDGPRQASELEMKETDDTHITEPTPAMSVDAKESERTAGSKPRPTLVFVNSTMAVDDLHQELQFRGVASCVPFHREMPQAEADRNLRDFLAGKVDVMVSTNLASRGIDFINVEHVVQFHFAQSLVDHIHRVGRTGRGGRSGEVTCFFRESDAPLVEAIRQAEAQNVQMTIQYKPTPDKYKPHKRRSRSSSSLPSAS